MKIDKATATEIAVNEVVDRYLSVLYEWRDLHNEQERLEKRVAELKAKQEQIKEGLSAYDAAAKVLGFDLNAEAKRRHQEREGLQEIPTEPPPEPKSAPSSKGSIKKFVLRAAQQAHPKPVRAASIRADLAAQGEEVHEKTVGMTLYRLLKKGLLKREGFDWYFVPEEERTAQEEGADA